MKLTILEKTNNPILKRKEVKFKVEHEGAATPSKMEVADLLAAKLNAKKDLMFIKRYAGEFGVNVSTGLCVVYEDEDAMDRAEPKKMLNPEKRIGAKPKPAEEKTAEAEPAEKKPEAPAEKAEGAEGAEKKR